MIQSMTAFVRQQHQADWGEVVFELRSLNHRFLDINLRLPESLQVLETEFRAIIKQQLKRGKIDCVLQNLSFAQQSTLALNQTLMAELQQQIGHLADSLPVTATVEITRLLQWPGMLNSEDVITADIIADIIQAFRIVLEALAKARQREGKELARIITARLQDMLQVITEIKQQLPAIQQQLRDKLRQQFERAKLAVDSERFDAELIYYLQKQDVAEELDRLCVHIHEIQRLVNAGDAIGRRLDFFMQELNREANTLSAKSADAAITQQAVELKVLIEQIREQVQNIE